MRRKQPPLQSLFFDIGDTLVFDDPPLRERLVQAAQAIGQEIDTDRLPAAFRAGEDYAVTRYVEGIPWDAPDSLRETVARVWAAMDYSALDDFQWPVFAQAFQSVPFTRHVLPHALDLLTELRRRGFILGAISDWEPTLPDLLAELGLLPSFDALAVSSLVGATKPSPTIFNEALRQADASPETALHIGDWYELDVAGARATDMQALLFDHQNRRPQADCPRVTTFEQLTDYLLALPIPKSENQKGLSDDCTQLV